MGMGNTTPLTLVKSVLSVHPHGHGEHTKYNRLIIKDKKELRNSTEFFLRFSEFLKIADLLNFDDLRHLVQVKMTRVLYHPFQQGFVYCCLL